MIETIGALTLFLYLLPGVVGLFFYGLFSESIDPSKTTKLSSIIVITLVSVFIVSEIIGQPILPDTPKNVTVPELVSRFFGANFWYTCLFGGILGILAALINNYHVVLRLFRWAKITSKTGKDDIWHESFKSADDRWCRIRFDDGKILVGWIKYYSMDSSRKGLLVGNAIWYFPIRNGFVDYKVEGPSVFVTNFDKVIAIDFLD